MSFTLPGKSKKVMFTYPCSKWLRSIFLARFDQVLLLDTPTEILPFSTLFLNWYPINLTFKSYYNATRNFSGHRTFVSRFTIRALHFGAINFPPVVKFFNFRALSVTFTIALQLWKHIWKDFYKLYKWKMKQTNKSRI